MAEGVVTLFLQNLSDLVKQEAQFLIGVKDQVKLLQDELEWIRLLLRDADEKRGKSKKVNIWVSQIRDVAYDAEDTIEMFLLKAERERLRRSSIIGPLGRYVCYITQLPTIHRLGNQIEEINTRLERISNNKSKYGIDELQADEYSASSSSNEIVAWKANRAHHIAENEDVVGFKKEEEELAKKLLEQGDHKQFGVVCIVGMGGLGKTTLAKKIYYRDDVKKHFDCRAFIYVSQEFTTKTLLHSTVKQITGLSEEEMVKKKYDELRNMLADHLKEKNSLLVFDDVWKGEDWDRLQHDLVKVSVKKGRVLLTTRNEEVAKHANPLIYQHNLRLFEEGESWELFVKVVFRETNFPKELKSLGERIVAKCGGLPLAIVVLGGLLYTKEKTIAEWTKVVDSAIWRLSHGSKQCLQVLALSYNDLPHYLKSCFLYFGLFPEDAEINASQLIRMWIAEGFIEERDNEMMEDIGEDYLEELIQRSMIQAEKRRIDGGVETCRIHDLLREMAISEAKKDKFLNIHDGNFNLVSPQRTRRLAIHHNNNNNNSSNSSFGLQCSDLNHLRSLLYLSESWIQKDLWKNLCRGIKLLRVLELGNTIGINSLPDEIGKLIFLKYLGLENTSIRRLPHAVGNLCNLQTLNLSLTEFIGIPSVIWKLHKLRHVQLYRSGLLEWKSTLGILCNEFVMDEVSRYRCCGRRRRIERLRDLQTLWLPAGSWIENGLHKLTNLRELRIIEGRLHTYRAALSKSISKMVRLRVLHLDEDTSAAFLPLVTFSDHVHLYELSLSGRIEKLVDFPPNLIKLTLKDSELKQDQVSQTMAELQTLPKLRNLELYFDSFMGTEMTCSDRGFPQLQELRLCWLNNLEVWIVEKGAMPNLRVLCIRSCGKLKMLPDGLRYMTTLHTLEIRNLSKELMASVDKESGGEDWEKISHVPNLKVN